MPQNTEHISQLYIEYSGSISGGFADVPTKYRDNLLISVDIDDSLYLPDMFSIHLFDPDLNTLTDDFFKPGRFIKLSVKMAGSNSSKTEIMRGEITAIEPDINSHERTTLMVRGYDLSHKMNRTRLVETYQNITDSDLASKLAQRAGLTAQVTSTSVVYPYIMQANQTDWELLQERATRIGYRLYVEGPDLHFKPSPSSPAVTTELKWGESLETFKPRLSTIEQLNEVTVRGWDPKAKAAIVGHASSPTNAPQHRKDNGSTGGSFSQSAHSSAAKGLIVDMPVYNQSEADKTAQALLDKSAAKFVTGQGRAGGNPAITAGSAVDIKNVGDRFNGKYLVTRAVHHYTDAGYTTTFWVSSGAGDMTITDILQGGGGNGTLNGSKAHGKATDRGVTVGIVTNNNDPDNLGRVQVKFPSLGDNIQSYWCRLGSPMTGGGRGISYFPEANDEVIVAFAHGDPNHGYVLGSVWNGTDKLPKPLGKLVTGSQTIRRVIRSRKGHEIMIDDSGEPTEGIIIVDSTEKNRLQIKTLDNKIIIRCKGDLEITSDEGDITITATQGKVTMTGQKDIGVQSQNGNLALEAALGKSSLKGMQGIEASSSSGPAKMAGLTAELNGQTTANVIGSATTTIKGGIVNINS